jgi:hypothetical protein
MTFQILSIVFNALMKVWYDYKGEVNHDNLDNGGSCGSGDNTIDEDKTQKTKRIFKNWILRFMTTILWLSIMVVISQQLALLSTRWHEKTEDREIKLRRWNHDCGGGGGDGNSNKAPPMDPDIVAICAQLKVIINTYPFIRAFHSVINEWNSCITMPCSQLVKEIGDNTGYKLLIVCIFIALTNYFYKFFGLAKVKTDKWKKNWQFDETVKRQQQLYLQQQQQQQQQMQFIHQSHLPLQPPPLSRKHVTPLFDPNSAVFPNQETLSH